MCWQGTLDTTAQSSERARSAVSAWARAIRAAASFIRQLRHTPNPVAIQLPLARSPAGRLLRTRQVPPGAPTLRCMTDVRPAAVFLAAQRFLLAQGRLLERRLFGTLYADQPADGVLDALRGYQNADGGFGHGLEPDKRCPASLPIDVEVAFQTMAAAGTGDAEMLRGACDFLGRTAAQADAGGAVPLAFPVIESFPRAEHWSDWTYQPGVNPTAGLAGLLYQLDFDHPWRAAATGFCWQAIETGNLPDEVHALAEVLAFLAHVPDRERAGRHAPG